MYSRTESARNSSVRDTLKVFSALMDMPLLSQPHHSSNLSRHSTEMGKWPDGPFKPPFKRATGLKVDCFTSVAFSICSAVCAGGYSSLLCALRTGVSMLCQFYGTDDAATFDTLPSG